MMYVFLCFALAAASVTTDEAPTEETIDVGTSAPVEATWFGETYPVIERIIDQQTARTVRPQSFNSIISHRNFEAFAVAPFSHLLGFDAGVLKVGLRLRYGIMEHWDAAFYRQSFATDPFSTWEFDTRFQVLNQNEHYVDVAARGGFTWFEAQTLGRNQSFGGFGELMVTRLFVDRLLVNLAFLFHSNSNGLNKTEAADPIGYSAAILVGAEVRILEWLAWSLEVDTNVLGYRQTYPVIVTGPRFYTNRHSFTLTFSNSQYSSSDSIITNTSNIAFDTWLFGFNITREIDI